MKSRFRQNEEGAKVAKIALERGINESSIRAILREKEKIKKSKCSDH